MQYKCSVLLSQVNFVLLCATLVMNAIVCSQAGIWHAQWILQLINSIITYTFILRVCTSWTISEPYSLR